MPTDNEVAQRIAGRQWFEEVLAELSPSPFRQGFLAAALRCFTVQEIDPKAMSDEEAREFGKLVMGFGKHHDKTYDDCPLDYLDWLGGENATLGRYLRSRRIREERERDA